MAGFTKDATVRQAIRLNKIIKKAKETNNEILFTKIGDENDLKILAISDAALNRRENKTQSIMGKAVFLSNLDETKVCPIILKSKSIHTVCKSAKDAETRGFEKTAEEAIYIARSLKEILTGHRNHDQLPVTMVTDSQSLVDSINSSRQIESKLLRCTIKWIKQMVDSGYINNIRWCDTNVCLSDALTKPGSKLASVLLEVCSSGRMIDLKFSKKKNAREGI